MIRADKTVFLKLLCCVLLSCLLTKIIYFTVPEVLELTDNSPSETVFVLRLVFSTVLMTLFFVWLSNLHGILRFLLIFFVFLPSVSAWFIGLKYDAICNAGFFANALLTNAQEAESFFTYQVFLFYAAYIVLCLVLSILTGRTAVNFYTFKKAYLRRLFHCGVFLLLCLSFSFHFYPIRTYYRVSRYLYQGYTEILDFVKNTDYLEKNPEANSVAGDITKDTVLFLHLGESVRADHASVNGYGRKTTPHLDAEQKKGNLFSFRKTVSFGVSTRFSMAGMMTSASINNSVISGAGIMTSVHAAGIPAAAFFSSMSGVSSLNNRYDVAIKYYTMNADDIICSHDWAHSLLPEIKKMAARPGSRFIIYNGEGSHLPFSSYDKNRFSEFMPVNFTKEQNETTTNAYDNTVLCTDDFIGSVMDILRDKKAVFVYASDHGEILGEKGCWGRSADAPDWLPCMRYVLFFVWVSDRFIKEEPEKYAALKRNISLSAVSHDYIYHTIMGLYNLRNRQYDSTMDLFSFKAKAFGGPFPEDLPKKKPDHNFIFDVSGR